MKTGGERGEMWVVRYDGTTTRGGEISRRKLDDGTETLENTEGGLCAKVGANVQSVLKLHRRGY